ncbi:MAG: hypothetical protein IJM14_06050 [Lachnospiraceae bacterium]|nr:hypothetical protein [Lachnospiraceae bacterium]
MRNIIYLLLALIIGVVIFFALKKNSSEKKEDNTASDYQKIETVKKALDELSGTSAIKTAGSDQGQWYIFDMRLIDEKTEAFYVQLKTKLGKDFNSKLSNGDYLFIGVFPLRGSYRIYAGDPADSNNMLYPDWKYTKLEKK